MSVVLVVFDSCAAAMGNFVNINVHTVHCNVFGALREWPIVSMWSD